MIPYVSIITFFETFKQRALLVFVRHSLQANVQLFAGLIHELVEGCSLLDINTLFKLVQCCDSFYWVFDLDLWTFFSGAHAFIPT